MRVIALDSTTRTGSVALVEDGRIVEERRGDGSRSHAERLPMAIVALARAHGVALGDVDLYAVASGPGSFTGLRIGIATMQGLAFVHGRRIFAVSVLDALAHAASAGVPPGTLIAAWMDAYRRDVFAALYRVSAAAPLSAARLEAIDGPRVDTPAAILPQWMEQLPAPRVTFVGDGAELFRHDIEQAMPGAEILPTPLVAGTIGLLAAAQAHEAVHAAAVRPLYVRRPDAEIARDARS